LPGTADTEKPRKVISFNFSNIQYIRLLAPRKITYQDEGKGKKKSFHDREVKWQGTKKATPIKR